jgi:DNA-binding NarL/FixJ family response regulator
VEVIGRYSNHSDQVERIQDILEMVPSGLQRAPLRPPKQVHRRLSPTEVDDLVTQYQAGETVKYLAARHNIHRYTVSSILDRQHVPRRRSGIPSERLHEVVSAYLAGASLAVIGAEMFVDPATVSRALRQAGVSIRPRRGWQYSSESGTSAI